MYKYFFIFFSVAAMAADKNESLEPIRPRVHSAMDFEYTPVNYKNYVLTAGTTVGSVYNIGFRYGFEWNPLNKYGKLFLGAGVGFTTAPNSYDLGDGVPRSFYTFPIDIQLSYHLDYFNHQIIVPFGKVGLVNTIGTLVGSGRNLENHMGINFGGGAKLLLNKLDSTSANNLFANAGISYTYLVVEYIISVSSGFLSTADFSSTEIRAGLRFEI
jgi:hypothetical protein